MPTVVHFEIPADDIDRAKSFYHDLFGWEINPVPEMEYWLITTSGEKPVNGGMMNRMDPHQKITNYIDVASIDDYVAKVKKLAGKIVVPKMPVPGMGYYAVCLDTENNPFGLWEDDPNAK